jgi:hypothetical protein
MLSGYFKSHGFVTSAGAKVYLWLEQNPNGPERPSSPYRSVGREVLCDEPQFGAGGEGRTSRRAERRKRSGLRKPRRRSKDLSTLECQVVSRLYPLVLAAEQEVRSLGGEEGVKSLIERLEGVEG